MVLLKMGLDILLRRTYCSRYASETYRERAMIGERRWWQPRSDLCREAIVLMARRENWVMVRRVACKPFVITEGEWDALPWHNPKLGTSSDMLEARSG